MYIMITLEIQCSNDNKENKGSNNYMNKNYHQFCVIQSQAIIKIAGGWSFCSDCLFMSINYFFSKLVKSKKKIPNSLDVLFVLCRVFAGVISRLPTRVLHGLILEQITVVLNK